MLKLLIAELIGTFVLLSVVLATGSPIPIAVGLLASIYAVNDVSGGHVNPVVSLVMWAKGDLSAPKLMVYIMGQILGGMFAFLLYKWFKDTNKKGSNGF